MPTSHAQYQLPRDFTGHGPESHDCQWPQNARIALSFVLNYEEGGERSILEGDAHSEPYLWEKGASGGPPKTGARYLNAEQDFEYGSRVGVWRLMRLFREFGWRITIFAVARAMELNGRLGKYCVREAGHEIANHGLRWLDFSHLEIDEDKKYVKESQLRLRDATGEFPVGVYFGRSTPNTPGALAEIFHEMNAQHGTPKLLYSSECYNDDVPYWVDLPYERHLPESERERMLLVPYNYDCNDGKFHMAPGFMSSAGQTYEDYLKSTFDCLYREGGKMMNIPLHSRITGKAGRCEALRRFCEYVSQKEGVWVTTRRDIANHYRTTFPYKPGSARGGQ
ncbi:chitin deacetylase 1 [Hortaea werneckii]|nr:chitin deacetylase 1 [Hortaea werneckii]KAI7097116.1 chitin deacetylase 1 [Hortaea werneckii]KAI7209048.1 chitin deacetylase 1 [Hortaea werneckii]KAI7320344.1 chitin deacetylase 1 [Hortaea werneckii]KAI7378577.1 chitin deacetylase 1 [Hortaea werneckii]